MVIFKTENNEKELRKELRSLESISWHPENEQ